MQESKPTSPFLYGIKPEVIDYYRKSTSEVSKLLGHNSGNILFVRAIYEHTDPCCIADWDEELSRTDLQSKTCIIPSANFLGPHADMGFMNSKIKNFEGLILSIGLGSQSDDSNRPLSIPAGTREWLDIISSKCKPNTQNIAVRGSSTLNDLDAIGMAGNAVITGCPSNFLSDDPRLGESIARKLPHIFERVCVASGHYKWDYLKSIEQDLLKLASETGGFYVMQSPSEMIALGLNKLQEMDVSVQEAIRCFCYPESSSEEFEKLVRRIFKVYLNVSDWMLDMSKHSLVIGARIHGVMAGIQAGVPSLCIAHDPRTIELCQEMKIPYLTREQVTSGLDKAKVAQALDIDWNAYDRRRALLLERYYSFLASNGVTPSRCLARLKAQLCEQQAGS